MPDRRRAREAVAALRSDYNRARTSLEDAVRSLSLLLDRRSRRDSDGAAEVTRPRTTQPVAARLNVTYGDASTLLAFQDELQALPGVETVTVAGVRPGNATLLVFYYPPGGDQAAERDGTPTIVCVQCGKVLQAGRVGISHGLCQDCTRDFIASRTVGR